MLFGLRVWVAKKITSIFDTTLISANVTFKTFFEELWQLMVQLANIVIVAVLGLFYKQGYQSYWEEKNRIKKKSSKKQIRRKPSPFLQLLNEQNEIDGYNTTTTTTPNTSSGASSPTSSPNLSSSSYRRSTSPLLKYNSSNTSLKKSPSLETTPKYNTINCSHISHTHTNSGGSNSGSGSKSKSSKKFKKVNSFTRQDLVHQHEQITTGLLEDIRTNLLLFFDASFGWLRSTISSILARISGFSIRSLFFFISTFPFYLPYYIFYIITTPFILINKVREFIRSIGEVKKLSNKIISGQELDIRTVKEIIEQSGYPYEKIHVTTDDGYILELERIPNKKSTNVLYLQHGIFDNSFAWIATGPAQSLAFAAYDQGYDVFLGNLRGNGDRLHQNSKISSKEYWNFSMNEHAFLDIPTFIQNIRKIKSKELFGLNNINTKVNLLNPINSSSSSTPNNTTTTSTNNSTSNVNNSNNNNDDDSSNKEHPVDSINISAIAHSMGAAVLLMYIVRCRMLNKPHYISKAIVLSPAGYHKKAPKIVDILAPLINIWLYLYPIHVFRFPNESIKVIIAKIYHDAMSNLPTKNLLVYLVSRYLLGGDTRNHPLTTIHNLAYNTFNGTSVLIYRHFWQIRRSRKFETFDYGPKKNLELYGTSEPLNILNHYNLIDIPIHFIMGLKDNLIDPVNIIRHYVTLKRYHPELAFLKASKNGHIEFTLGLDDQIRSYCLNVLEITPSTQTPIISTSSSSNVTSPTHHIHSLSSTKFSGSVSNKLNASSSNLDKNQQSKSYHH
ncbi:hypothetical protein RB653_010406 [Dictyostelium firmibasis]|uniref:Partial AB-hydrolase lipase domain-containing protein n=1 Tax=Dictyostelium firmibasis TaxID=79012 RepID=A0AAN7YVT0_9MYCE